jgi:hypothetical protein
MSEQKPSVGRIVHFWCPGAETQPQAAMILWVGLDRHEGEGRVHLRVFGDTSLGGDLVQDWNEEAVFSAEPVRGCWTWPPRV